MHRCWSIPEVQHTIFQEVYQLCNGKVTLAHVARTCRILNGVALDVLWVKLDSFVHLIKCLPRDLWKIDHKKLIFLRPMSLKDWAVFFSYSNRVRILSQDFGCIYRIGCGSLDIDVIYTLSNPPTRRTSLIPNLRELHWGAPDKKHVPLLHALLTPTLVTLSLSSCALRSPEVLILTSIGVTCQSLKNFRITWSKQTSDTLDAKDKKILSEALLHLRSLETLSCPVPDEAAMIHVSHLPLVDLTLKLPSNFEPEKVRPYMVPPAFASLKSLKLQVHSLPILMSLLKSMRVKPTSVSFFVESTPTPEALCLFFLALVSACDTMELLNISFATSSAEQPSAPPQSGAFTLSTLQPLLALPNLESFDFDVPCDMALDDNAIASLTKHWPKLTMLSLNPHTGWGIPSGITHRGLITLLGCCPELSSFELAVDLSDVDLEDPQSFESVRPGGGVSNVQCCEASLVTSTITHPVSIAIFLSDICPNLFEVRSAWRSDFLRTNVDQRAVGEYVEKWDEVERLLPAFLEVRRQSMNWIQQEESVAPGSVLEDDDE